MSFSPTFHKFYLLNVSPFPQNHALLQFKWSMYSFFLTEMPSPLYLGRLLYNLQLKYHLFWEALLSYSHIMTSSNNLAVYFPAPLTEIQTLQRQ